MSRAVKIAAWLVKSLRKRLFSASMICSAWEMFAVFDPAGAHQSPSRIQLSIITELEVQFAPENGQQLASFERVGLDPS